MASSSSSPAGPSSALVGDPTLLHPQVIRGLTDKLYEKRKAAALEIERIIRECLLTGDQSRISAILTLLIDDFAYSVVPNARNGGLISLAAVAIALGSSNVTPFLPLIAPPILSCFSDQDSRVRYYACESMYNVAKVARASILTYFNPIFDALSRLYTDPEVSVKNGAELLDRLIKDIVSEKSQFSDKNPRSVPQKTEGAEIVKDDPRILKVPGTVRLPGSNLSYFSLERFIPLLVERIQVTAPATRLFLVNWIAVLDSVPDLELVTFLPEFLSGLFNYLSDPNQDIRTATLNVLGEFLKEIRDVVDIQREKGRYNDTEQEYASPLGIELSGKKNSESNVLTSSSGHEDTFSPSSQLQTRGSTVYSQGQGISLDFSKMTHILQPYLSSLDEETQATALRWTSEFILMARELMLPLTTLLINAILPTLAHPVAGIRSIAIETNSNLYRLVFDFTSESLTASSASVMANLTALSTPELAEASLPSISTNELNVSEAVAALMKQFENEHEETRVSTLEWLLMLHKNIPEKVITSDPAMISALLQSLSDQSEEVVRKDIQLLAQISHHSDRQYFSGFMVNLLNLFSTDRRLLESRGSLIVRQLCLSLDPERIFRTFAEILDLDEDLEFASLMVQNLNIILITAPELADLRRRLKNIDAKDKDHIFPVLYRCWGHNPVALFSLCLLASAYEHASNLLQIFAELEMTVSLLIQLDKLVQLIESPVFTYLRLQLLEPEKYPHLFKCLYGILMLLPQSSAFVTLRNRLNSINSLVTLYGSSMPAISSNGTTTPKRSFRTASASTEADVANQQRWWQDLLEHFRAVQDKHSKLRKDTRGAEKISLKGKYRTTRTSHSVNVTEDILSDDSRFAPDKRTSLISQFGRLSVRNNQSGTSSQNVPTPVNLRSLNRKGSAPSRR